MKELESISGVGTEWRKALESAGIETLSELARMKAEEIEATVGGVSLTQANSWIEQARRLQTSQVKARISDTPLYRILRNLSKGERIIRPSIGFHRLPWCDDDDIEALISACAIAPARTPPLDALPGWLTRANKLKHLGIITVLDLQNVVNISDVSNYLGVKEQTFLGWQDEALSWIKPNLKAG